MFQYEVKFKPLPGFFADYAIIEANDILDAKAHFYRQCPKGILLSCVEVSNRMPCEVIYVNFKTKKRVA